MLRSPKECGWGDHQGWERRGRQEEAVEKAGNKARQIQREKEDNEMVINQR